MRPLFLLAPLFPSISLAAISVSGISSNTNYNGGTRTVTVDAPAGFTTTATLNSEVFPVGTPVNISGARFYELIVTETPDGGGAPVVESFLFNIREPERGSSETGLPAFVAAPLVNDAPSAVNTGHLEIILPTNYPDELALPLVARLKKADGDPLWLHSLVGSENFPDHPVQLRRGFGYTILPPQTENATYDARTASLSTDAHSTIESGTIWTEVAGTINSNTIWPANSRVHLTGDLTIEAGATLTIESGTIIKIATAGDVHVDGHLDINGTPASPVVFAPASAPDRWGGFFLQETTSNVEAEGAIFFGACYAQNWFNDNAGYASHRDEQAVFLVGPAGANLDLTDCFLIENDGQLLHNDEGGDISIQRSLLQGATSCGELTGGTLLIDRSALLAFPDATPDFEDGDNDAIYLTSGQHLISNTVIAFTKDDGIDTGGSPAASTNTVSTAQNVWFESILHEGMSNSGPKTCNAFDCVFFNCGQTIESGYGGPQSTIARSLSVANLVGARMGDNYNWDYENNHLTVEDCFLIENLYHDIWGWDWSSWTYNTAKMTVTNNYISRPQDLARHPDTNTAFDPQAHGSLLAPFMPVPGSKVGVAITGIESQGQTSKYSPDFRVQLSTFSSREVTVSYSLTGKPSTNEDNESLLQSGTLTFTPGQTSKDLFLELPDTPSFGLLRVALSSPGNAEITGSEAWYFDTPSGGPQIIIPRSTDGWKYDASRAEPAGDWKTLSYDDGSWKDATTEIGFGEGDENTTLTPAEQGPSNDRTNAVYFRKVFPLTNAPAITELLVKLNADDGAVVYLNGIEIDRVNIDDGPVDYTTDADNASPENTFVDMPVPANLLPLLQNGDNIIAVEVHQSSNTSSDLGFDLELLATIPAADDSPSGLSSFDGKQYLYWLNPLQELEQSDDLNTWTPMRTQSSPYLIPTDSPQKFFRLRRD